MPVHAELALDQQPAAGVGVVDLIAGEEVGMLGEEALEEVFGVVGLLVHRAEIVAVEKMRPFMSLRRARGSDAGATPG